VSLVSLKLRGKKSPVGDFEVLRALPQIERRFVGPFCFFDHMGPHTAVGTRGGGVGPHPHIGLSTVTLLFEGSALHRDSLGTVQRITPGDVNWMTSGRGIVHSERTPEELIGQSSTMHGLQVWVALPKELEECEPSFQHAPASTLPRMEENGVKLSVALGDWLGARSPIRLPSPTFYVIAELEQGSELELPAHHPERALYVVDGDVTLDGQSFSRGELAVLTPHETGAVTALTPARIAVFGGAPLDGHRHLSWNFVSSRPERLKQAREDWKQNRFPLIPGDSDERIPFPGD
jgi:redox-sensitive bicupin YhaK (pirin superfamily)